MRFIGKVITTGTLMLGLSGTGQAGFFEVCIPEGDATIEVTQNTTVKNENATLPGDNFDTCNIVVADGVRLKFEKVTVNVTGDKRLVFEGGDNSKLIISNSTLHACDNDIFGFSDLVKIVRSALSEPIGPGCDLLELEPDGDLKIFSSTLSGEDTIDLSSGKTITVKNSTMETENNDINIGAAFADSQNTTIRKTTIITPDDINIGAQQKTKVINNDLQADGMISISGDPCTSKANTPDVPCL